MDRKSITGVVLTFNSELTLDSTLKSLLRIADHLVVLDSGSNDATLDIAKKYNATIHCQAFAGFAAQRKAAYIHAKTEWIFALDADETISLALADEINSFDPNDLNSSSCQGICSSSCQGTSDSHNSLITGIRVPILNFFNKKPLCYGGMYPDFHLRLFKKECSHVEDNRVHEGIKTSGKIVDLSQPILHYPYRDLAHLIEKMTSYAVLASEQLYQDNRKMRATWFNILLRPCWSFFSKFFMRLGFLDGFNGLVYHLCHAGYVFMKYFMLRERFEKADLCKKSKIQANRESRE